MGIFKANDIRGIYPTELTPETCYRIGDYLPEIVGCRKILVGRDTRLSSDILFKQLVKGIFQGTIILSTTTFVIQDLLQQSYLLKCCRSSI
ncbi:MAG: hypothetical protein DRP59_11495 [Spirochaetes bacterium]|nr:MAG: hypothetical protein DRP59_11495 [Spirochaetota bacterium]